MQVHMAIKQNNHITWLNKLRGQIKKHTLDNLVKYSNKYAEENKLGDVILCGRVLHIAVKASKVNSIQCRDSDFLELENIYLMADRNFDHLIYRLSRACVGGNFLFMKTYFPEYMNQLRVIESNYGSSEYYVDSPVSEAERSLAKLEESRPTQEAIQYIKLYQMVMP